MEEIVLNKKRNRAYWLLIISSFILYIVMTSAKNLYVAEKTTLYTLGMFGNLTDLAATMEYYFYTYAAAQLFMVLMMKHLNLKWYVTLCLSASAVITVLMSFTGNILQHYVLYTVNGFFQACLWGCQIKVFSLYLPMRLLPTANRAASAGPAVAGAVAYGIAAAFGDNWRAPFFMVGVLLFAIVLLYFFFGDLRFPLPEGDRDASRRVCGRKRSRRVGRGGERFYSPQKPQTNCLVLHHLHIDRCFGDLTVFRAEQQSGRLSQGDRRSFQRLGKMADDLCAPCGGGGTGCYGLFL
ncbi:MAG: MFS transporter [Clostridia bacterium]|nr:MFS transporter [Clostridia bacterium]